MSSVWRQHSGPVLASAALHGLLVAALIAGLPLSGQRARAPVPAEEQLAIQATVVDETVIEREMAMLEQQEREEALRQQQAEREAREAAEAARRAREEEQRQLEEAREQAAREEEQRLAEQQRAAEEQERLAEEQRQRELEEQRRLEAERQAREEEERLARLEEERRQREAEEAAREQARLEAELQQAIEAEDERRAAERAGLMDEYTLLIQRRIEQQWIRPATARAGLDCTVNVAQIPSGDVVAVQIGQCNGDEAVVRSIEAAVRRASPLPPPPNRALFERNLVVRFRPDG